MKTALLVTAHGSIESLDELPGFLRAIRRGHPVPDDVLREVKRRYEAIGGRSPLRAITEAQAAALGAALDMHARVAMRLSRPSIPDVLRELSNEGFDRVVSVPIAPYSVHVYHAAVDEAARALGRPMRVVHIAPWNVQAPLVAALADAAAAAVRAVPVGPRAVLVFSAHSLPVRAIESGDPYAALVGATAEQVGAALRERHEIDVATRLAYQSQGMTADTWLGPDLPHTFRDARDAAFEHIVMAPIGFLADHIEILYDLDIEAVALARALGITLTRTVTLDAHPGLVAALRDAVRASLVEGREGIGV